MSEEFEQYMKRTDSFQGLQPVERIEYLKTIHQAKTNLVDMFIKDEAGKKTTFLVMGRQQDCGACPSLLDPPLAIEAGSDVSAMLKAMVVESSFPVITQSDEAIFSEEQYAAALIHKFFVDPYDWNNVWVQNRNEDDSEPNYLALRLFDCMLLDRYDTDLLYRMMDSCDTTGNLVIHVDSILAQRIVLLNKRWIE